MTTDRLALYIITELQRYFPDAVMFTADYTPAEQWVVVQTNPPHFAIPQLTWVHEVGPDDDWFIFVCRDFIDPCTVTVPFPEWLEEVLP